MQFSRFQSFSQDFEFGFDDSLFKGIDSFSMRFSLVLFRLEAITDPYTPLGWHLAAESNKTLEDPEPSKTYTGLTKYTTKQEKAIGFTRYEDEAQLVILHNWIINN